MLRMFAGAVALIATCLPAAAEDAVSTFTLDNGMDVVVIEDHRAPVVTHMVWYRAGSADETPGSSGVAHFLEHLMFKGTDTMASGELSATVARNGGSDNAFTSYDYTAYHQRIAADRLGLVMRMEADRMANLKLTEDDIATEREVIIEERNQRVEVDPGALFREQKSAAQYLNHRYGIPVIGWRHEMEALDQQKARAFYDQFYAPNNAILIVAGDVQPDEVLTLAKQYYGAIPANPNLAPRIRPQEPPQTAARRLIYRDKRVAQPYVVRSYLVPERDTGAQKDAAALTILAEVLGGSTTSVLAKKLQFDQELAIYAAASYSGTSLDDSTFSLFVVPDAGTSLQQAEDAMDEVLTDFLQTGVDETQLDRIKMQIRAGQIYARDDVSALANRYGRALTQGLTVRDVQEWPEILQAVTAEDVMNAARTYLNHRQSVTGWLMAEETAQ